MRNLFARVPAEMGLPPGTVGKLDRCCYGTRDAGQLWEETYAHVLVELGFIRSTASPCCFFHPLWQVSVVCHGDEFIALGIDDMLDLYEAGLAKAFELGEKLRLG